MPCTQEVEQDNRDLDEVCKEEAQEAYADVLQYFNRIENKRNIKRKITNNKTQKSTKIRKANA